MDKSKKQKKVATDVNYIPRTENSGKQYKGENVTTSILNKEGLPWNVCQNKLGKRSGGTLERLTRWERSDVPDVQTCLTFPFIYICRYFADRQLLSLTVNTFIY